MRKALVAAFLFSVLCAPACAAEIVLIDETPTGEAPLWVRESWIGLQLPYNSIRECSEYGLITGVPHHKPGFGYVVAQDIALEALRAHAPRAWKWWHENGFPRYWHNGEVKEFCFYMPKVA